VTVLAERVPQLERVVAEPLPDGRLLLRLKDKPFDDPVLAKFVSDGTLKMLSYLTVLYDPDAPQLVGIEEPENHLHPRLLYRLAEECNAVSARTQIMVTTHSPFFVNALQPKQVRVVYRDEHGYTQAVLTSKIPMIKELVNESQLGYLWMEGYFDVGDPLDNGGRPKQLFLLQEDK